MLIKMVVVGTKIHVKGQQRMVNWIVSSMLMKMAVHGMVAHADMQL